MSASVDILHPDRPKRIVIVASNPAVSEQTGGPIGFCWAELSRPFLGFTERGYEAKPLAAERKTWTGFANSEERFVDDFVGRRVQRFWIEHEARKLENTNFIVSGRFKPHSGRAAARLMIEALGT